MRGLRFFPIIVCAISFPYVMGSSLIVLWQIINFLIINKRTCRFYKSYTRTIQLASLQREMLQQVVRLSKCEKCWSYCFWNFLVKCIIYYWLFQINEYHLYFDIINAWWLLNGLVGSIKDMRKRFNSHHCNAKCFSKSSAKRCELN